MHKICTNCNNFIVLGITDQRTYCPTLAVLAASPESRMRAPSPTALFKAELAGPHPGGGGGVMSLFEVTPFLRNALLSRHPVDEQGKCTRAGDGTLTLHCLMFMQNCAFLHGLNKSSSYTSL